MKTKKLLVLAAISLASTTILANSTNYSRKYYCAGSDTPYRVQINFANENESGDTMKLVDNSDAGHKLDWKSKLSSKVHPKKTSKGELTVTGESGGANNLKYVLENTSASCRFSTDINFKGTTWDNPSKCTVKINATATSIGGNANCKVKSVGHKSNTFNTINIIYQMNK